MGYEYLPEEEVSEAAFDAIMAEIDAGATREAVDAVHLECARGICPI